MDTLIVFSHLRWNFVYQRPQHLLARMSKRWRVVFIEEPVPGAPENRLEQLEPAPGVQVWRPHVTGEPYGFHDDHLPVLRKMVAEAMAAQQLRDYWVWFYTPMAYPLAADLSPRGIVYDCMDELTAFRNAPRQLVQRENALFNAADLVFTGGRSLYNAKKNRHPDVHCFPSSVDAKHFSEKRADHPLQAGIAHPRVGYCGVIDERVDLSIIDTLAQARPDWQIVMVGPVVKIDPASLPQRPNIHWLGQQSYDDLPAFISGWDVCMLPFALNEATRYISPTKTLEYMACGRPSVSTPIKDVVEPYGHLVSIAADPAQFLAACDTILARDADAQALHARALTEMVARTSWDRVAHSMSELIASADIDRTRSTAANAPSHGGVTPPVLADAAAATAARVAQAQAATARRAVAG